MNILKFGFFIFLSSLTFILLYWSGGNMLWKYHLESDTKVFYGRLNEFSYKESFTDFGQYDNLPGASLYFILPGFINPHISYDEYFRNFAIITIFLLLAITLLYKLIKKDANLYIALLVFVAFGPILLYRFEPLVAFLFLFSIFFFKKQKYFISGVFLGLGTIIKVYPLFILPYFCILIYKKHDFKSLINYCLGTFSGVLIVMTFYVCLGGHLIDPIKNLTSQALKPITLESIDSSIISLHNLFNSGKLPAIVLANGVWGIPIFNGAVFLNWLPYLACIALYVVIFFRCHKFSNFDIHIPILTILIFLSTSKYLNPQYLFWALSLLPLIKFRNGVIYFFLILNSVILLVLTQLYYPIYFTQVLDSFNSGNLSLIFYVLQLRNALIVLEILMIFYNYRGVHKNSD
jgi:hypothetical protein